MEKNESYTGTVHFHCDLSGRATPFPHFWEHAVGGDHTARALAELVEANGFNDPGITHGISRGGLERLKRALIKAENVNRLAPGRPILYTEWNTSSNPRDPLRRALRGCIRDQDRDGSERPGVHARSAPLTVCMINCRKEPLWTPLAKHKGILPPQACGAGD